MQLLVTFEREFINKIGFPTDQGMILFFSLNNTLCYKMQTEQIR